MSNSFQDHGQGFPFSSALRHAFIAADVAHSASLEVLRDAICEYVEELREQGVSPQHIAVALRRRAADLQQGEGTVGLGVYTGGIVDEMVESCLDGTV
jgi:hypothetical protein